MMVSEGWVPGSVLLWINIRTELRVPREMDGSNQFRSKCVISLNYNLCKFQGTKLYLLIITGGQVFYFTLSKYILPASHKQNLILCQEKMLTKPQAMYKLAFYLSMEGSQQSLLVFNTYMCVRACTCAHTHTCSELCHKAQPWKGMQQTFEGHESLNKDPNNNKV